MKSLFSQFLKYFDYITFCILHACVIVFSLPTHDDTSRYALIVHTCTCSTYDIIANPIMFINIIFV